MSGEAEHRTKVLRVATRCTSLDQFVEAFARYCERRTLFVASLTTRTPGSQSPFVILLSDGAQALRGTCEVVEAWATPGGPFRRPGVRIKFLQLDAASEDVLKRLHKFKPAPPAAPKPPVLPPLPQMKTMIGMPPKTPAPGTPIVAAGGGGSGPTLPSSVPSAVPAKVEPLGRGTMRVQAVVPPPGSPLPPLTATRATPPTGTPTTSTAPVAPPAVIPPRTTAAGTATGTTRMAGLTRPDATPIPSAKAATATAAAAATATAVAVPEPVAPPRMPSNVPEPVDAPYEPEHDPDDQVTDVQGSIEALRLIRESAPTDPPPLGEAPPGSDERAPGSPIILPANPLAQITDDSLRGFVECTLYEETGKFSFDDLLERAGTDGDDEDPIAEPPPSPDLRASLPPELKPNPRRDATPLPGMALAAAAITAKPARAADDGHDPEDSDADIPTDVKPEPAAVVRSPSPMTRTMIGHAAPPSAAPAMLGPIPGGDGSMPPPARAANPMFGDLAMPPPAGTPPSVSVPPGEAAASVAPGAVPARAASTSVDDDLAPARRSPFLFVILGAAVALIATVTVVYLLERGGAGPDVKASSKAKATLADAGALAAIDTGGGSASASGAVPEPDDGSGSGTAMIETGSGSGSGTGNASGTIEPDDGTGGSDDSGGQGAVPDPDDGAGELTDADRVPPPAGDCSANITTIPAGALVRSAGRFYGKTPLQAALPCGRVSVSISYRRYATVEKAMVLSAGKTPDVKLALSRPRHQIKIVSTPGGATVSINGSRIGKTPLTAKLPGYSNLSIEMRRAGFKTFRTKHYSKRSGEVVAARLEKGN